MSRLEEVEAEIADLDDSYSARTYTDGYADLARTLAAEVDTLTEENIRLDRKRFENVTCARRFLSQLRAAKVEVDELRGKLDALRAEADPQALVICHMQGRAEGDEVITKLLAMLEPGRGVFGTPVDDNTVSLSVADWQLMERLHARACEIAGRTE